MNEERLSSDREYVKKQVCKLIDLFFDDLIKVNKGLLSQEDLIKRLEFNKTMLARGYAIKLGILLTRKQLKEKHGVGEWVKKKVYFKRECFG